MGLWHWFLQSGSARPIPCLNTDWGEEASSRVCKTGRAVVQPLQRAGSDSGMNPELWHINRPAVRGHFHRAVHHGATSSPAVEKRGVGGARGASACKGEAALPDAVGNLLQRSGAVGAPIVFIGDQPIQQPVFGVCGKLRFVHYRAGSAARQDACNATHPSVITRSKAVEFVIAVDAITEAVVSLPAAGVGGAGHRTGTRALNLNSVRKRKRISDNPSAHLRPGTKRSERLDRTW